VSIRGNTQIIKLLLLKTLNKLQDVEPLTVLDKAFQQLSGNIIFTYAKQVFHIQSLDSMKFDQTG
jgi:hypothetical protein